MPLIIEKLAEGGFVLTDASWRSDPGRYCPPLFAATTIDEALKFIKDKMAAE